MRKSVQNPSFDGERDESMRIAYEGDDYTLRISRRYSYRDCFYFSLEDNKNLVIDEVTFTCNSAKEAYRECLSWIDFHFLCFYNMNRLK